MNDELERDDLDAWDVKPLGADFEDRVMEALDAPRSSPRRSRNRGVVRAAALSFAAAAVATATIALWPRGDTDPEDAITIRAGASAQVEYTPRSHQAEQTWGTVTYQVRRGRPFVVHTPAADITVHGTEFTVEMLTMQDERRRKYLGAGALALGGAAVAVYVASGEVSLHNDHGRVELAPGGTAVASEHASPRSEPVPSESAAEPAPSPRPKLSAAKREDVKRRLEGALAKRRAAGGGVSNAGSEDEPNPDEFEGALDKDYIREVVREDLAPIARECYEAALERAPDLAGTVILKFSIAGDESVGGIVDEVSFSDATVFQDHGEAPPEGTHVDTVPATATARPKLPLAENPEFAECLSESTASVLFDPPEGGGRVEVTFPFVFEQNKEPAGD